MKQDIDVLCSIVYKEKQQHTHTIKRKLTDIDSVEKHGIPAAMFAYAHKRLAVHICMNTAGQH